MADDAKKSVDDSAEQKGRAEDIEVEAVKKTSDEVVAEETKENQKEENKKDDSEDKIEQLETSDADKAEDKKDSDVATTENKSKDDEADDESDDAKQANVEISIEIPEDSKADKDDDEIDFQESVREQIENCKFEIIASIQESVHTELKDYVNKQIRKIERRRKIGVVVRDVLILLLAAVVGYFGYCLYDAKYFAFMKSECERNGTCAQTDDTITKPVEVEQVKDTAWYQRNFGYLFDSLKINLNADKVSAYYLYSGDYKASEIQPSYLLAMAYNRLNSNITYDSDKGIMIPANDLRTSFVNLFGNADLFAKSSFTYDCADFTYDRESDSFITPSVQCNSMSSNREILEEIDEIYEEGNVMYFITTATIYDKTEESFYTFDNLFKPVVKSAMKDEVSKYKAQLNQYQYRFKKVNDQYYFSDVTKLK